MQSHWHTQVLIIGGGVTGTGIARDLALRGVQCIVVEKEDINAGASGGNHGILHSGARYVVTDPPAAEECREENLLLKRVAPQCIEEVGGLYVAVQGDDEKYVADFPHNCERCGIPAKPMDIKDALELEPELSRKVMAVYETEDASVDPFRLSFENISHARQLGSALLCHTKVTKFAKQNGHIQIVHLLNSQTGEEFKVEAEQVVNAAGAWVDEVAALAGASIDMVYSKGTLLVTHTRITKRAIIRLRWPADADALMPGGTVSVIGPTSVRLNSLADIRPTVEEVDFIVEDAAAMLPVLESTRYVRAFAGVRPLIASKTPEGDDHSLSRGFALLDHSHAGLKNFITITGGKLSTYRIMAERTADLVCERLGVTTPSQTRTEILPSAQDCKWTEPGLSPRLWIKQHNPEDILLCECEMVPKSAVDSIIETLHKQKTRPSLRAIGLRSRIGKGSCQGTFCSVRLAGYLYSRGELERDEGLALLRDFVRERWKGQHPILWGEQLMQAELSEAVHCGLLGLEL